MFKRRESSQSSNAKKQSRISSVVAGLVVKVEKSGQQRTNAQMSRIYCVWQTGLNMVTVHADQVTSSITRVFGFWRRSRRRHERTVFPAGLGVSKGSTLKSANAK